MTDDAFAIKFMPNLKSLLFGPVQALAFVRRTHSACAVVALNASSEPRTLTVYLRSLVEPGTEFRDRMIVGPHISTRATDNFSALTQAASMSDAAAHDVLLRSRKGTGLGRINVLAAGCTGRGTLMDGCLIDQMVEGDPEEREAMLCGAEQCSVSANVGNAHDINEENINIAAQRMQMQVDGNSHVGLQSASQPSGTDVDIFSVDGETLQVCLDGSIVVTIPPNTVRVLIQQGGLAHHCGGIGSSLHDGQSVPHQGVFLGTGAEEIGVDKAVDGIQGISMLGKIPDMSHLRN